jgi:hypothetical protein
MGKWSGRGQPPTRRKLHRYRTALQKERALLMRDENALRRVGDQDWKKIERKAEGSGVSLESFWQRWVDG